MTYPIYSSAVLWWLQSCLYAVLLVCPVDDSFSDECVRSKSCECDRSAITWEWQLKWSSYNYWPVNYRQPHCLYHVHALSLINTSRLALLVGGQPDQPPCRPLFHQQAAVTVTGSVGEWTAAVKIHYEHKYSIRSIIQDHPVEWPLMVAKLHQLLSSLLKEV